MANKTVVIPRSAVGRRLSDWLIGGGFHISADCGGRGTCGKCRVRVVSGTFISAEAPESPLKPDENGYILACRALCGAEGESVIELPDTEGGGLTEFSAEGAAKPGARGEASHRYGIALDVGTTTLAAALADVGSGEIIALSSRLNPQRVYGADVISRISASGEGRLAELQRLVTGAAAEIAADFAAEHPDKPAAELAVSGNTTMLHLFCGVSPEGMGAYPFTPAFTETKVLTGAELSLKMDKVTLLPSASAFIGGDITCGVEACGLTESDEPALFVDIGTNGEMVLFTGKKRGGRLYAASSAAGPALEGAKISCGMGGIDGAICRVSLDASGNAVCKTIGDKPARGICGCGLVDAVAVLLERGELDETGYLEEDFVLTSGVGGEIKLTQQDIREFQLAKSAIAAGLEALVAHASLKPEDICRIYIAGGLGYYMDTANAVRTGLLPGALARDARTVGNTSLAGAIASLCGGGALARIENIARECETVELNKSAVFNDRFVENMLFPEAE